MSSTRLVAPAILAVILLAGPAMADALVVTRAMQASTIAEVFIEDEEIRVQFEVGVADIRAFKNLLPQESYEKLARDTSPLDQRLQKFLEEDWVITVDEQPLQGNIQQIVADKRVLRDEITGQPLPNQPDDAEIVIRVRLSYPLPTKPSSLSIQPPLADDSGATVANIGFVVYHRGVAVNDFRYLARSETLRLDWSDPWYSQFERKNLRRRYDAPAAAFLYIDNFEVRKEIIFRPKDLQDWLDLGLDGKSVIAANQRDSVREKAAAFLGQHTPLKIDGTDGEGTLDRVHFINRTLRSTGVVEPGTDIDINTAMLGAIYVYPIKGLPDQVSMEWDLFNQRITKIPCVATDEAGGMPGTLDATDSTLVWQNFLKTPSTPAFMKVAPPAPPGTLPIPVVSLACLAAAGLVWKRRPSRNIRGAVIAIVLLLAVGTVSAISPQLRINVPASSRVQVSQRDASDVTFSLLHNIYRAFDYRDEGTVYDVLARSAAGDLLTNIYLDTRESLTLASQGGARVKVKNVELVDCQAKPDGQDSFVADCRWVVTGSVGHWGHLHERSNQYHGELVIHPIDGEWKIVEMELLSEERL